VKKTIAYFTLFLLLAGNTASWKPNTHKHICDKAVEEVWGQGIVNQCLPRKSSKFLYEFCKTVLTEKGMDEYNRCKNAVSLRDFIHPALYPDQIFNDTHLHHDYSKCPIRPGPAKNRLCGTRTEKPAQEEAERWFNIAGRMQDTCGRVYAFCVASSYLAKSENQFNQMKNFEEKCRENIEEAVDERVSMRDPDWLVYEWCEFKNLNYKQKIEVGDERIEKIIEDLVVKGREIKAKPMKSQKRVIVLANSIDYNLGGPFIDFLSERGLLVLRATAEDFSQHQYNKFIIILGGQNSPEGVGDVVRLILPRAQQDYLVGGSNRSIMAAKDNLWTMGQRVWVLAGYDRFLTANVSMEYADRVYRNITLG